MTTFLLLLVAYVLVGALACLLVERKIEPLDGREYLLVTALWPACLYIFALEHLSEVNRR